MKILRIMANDVVKSSWFAFLAAVGCLLVAGLIAGVMLGQVFAILSDTHLPWWVHSIGTAGWLVALCLWWLSAKERADNE